MGKRARKSVGSAGRSHQAGFLRVMAGLAVVLITGVAFGVTAVASGGPARRPFPAAAGGYLAGPIPARVPASSLFRPDHYIAGSPRVLGVAAGVVTGGSGRDALRVDVRVSYPGLARSWRGLLSGNAAYRGAVRTSISRLGKRGPPVTVGSASGWLALAVAPGGGRTVRTLTLTLPRTKARGLKSGGLVTARLDVSARFEPWGRSRTVEVSKITTRRRLRLAAPPPAAGTGQGNGCTGDADLSGGRTAGVYSGRLQAHAGQPLKIRLCTTAATAIDQSDWRYRTGFPEHGKASAPTLEHGYYAITYQPDPGFVGHDFFQLYNSSANSFIVDLTVRPWEMEAMGDSITAGFGFLGNGDPPQSNGNSNSFDALALLDCKPIENLNNRCSSNSDVGRGDERPPGKRWSRDFGLSNNVAWPAQFANWHGIGSGQFYNHAVTGSSPEDWGAYGKFNQFLDGMLHNDLTVLTLGANPLLGTFLQDVEFGKRCGATDGKSNIDELVQRAEGCLKQEMKNVELYERLRSIYRRLLDDPFNHVVVALYPVAWPPMPYYLATKFLVNNYEPAVLDRLTSLIDNEIRRAVDDEAKAARASGKGDRLFVISPPRFNLGVESYAQMFEGATVETCPDNFRLRRVDGPSNQSAATQEAASAPEQCRGGALLESMDGVHLGRAGHTVYANALENLIRAVKLPVPLRPGALVNELNAKCMDVAGGSSAEQTPLQMYPCDSTAAQQFKLTDGELHALGKCVDGTSGNGGSAITLVTCNGGAGQKWRLDDQRRLVGINGLCIDIVDQNQADRTKLHLWSCHDGPSQKWVGPGPL